MLVYAGTAKQENSFLFTRTCRELVSRPEAEPLQGL